MKTVMYEESLGCSGRAGPLRVSGLLFGSAGTMRAPGADRSETLPRPTRMRFARARARSAVRVAGRGGSPLAGG